MDGQDYPSLMQASLNRHSNTVSVTVTVSVYLLIIISLEAEIKVSESGFTELMDGQDYLSLIQASLKTQQHCYCFCFCFCYCYCYCYCLLTYYNLTRSRKLSCMNGIIINTGR